MKVVFKSILLSLGHKPPDSNYRMALLYQSVVIVLALLLCCSIVNCDTKNVSSETMQEGRTFVHHAMKRLVLFLPAFMFKLGIMFTMILVTTIASTNGLLVGALLLALGVGHFIANRFSSSVPATAHLTVPHYAYHSSPHFLDRSDTLQSQSSSPYVAHAQAYGAWKAR